MLNLVQVIGIGLLFVDSEVHVADFADRDQVEMVMGDFDADDDECSAKTYLQISNTSAVS